MAESQFDSLILLAARDAKSMRLLMIDTDVQNVAFFLAQQAIEKALKAVLSAKNVAYPLTHNLLLLKQSLTDIAVTCPASDDVLRRLMPFAVEGRYDEDIAPTLTLRQALDAVELLLQWAQQFRPTSDS